MTKENAVKLCKFVGYSIEEGYQIINFSYQSPN